DCSMTEDFQHFIRAEPSEAARLFRRREEIEDGLTCLVIRGNGGMRARRGDAVRWSGERLFQLGDDASERGFGLRAPSLEPGDPGPRLSAERERFELLLAARTEVEVTCQLGLFVVGEHPVEQVLQSHGIGTVGLSDHEKTLVRTRAGRAAGSHPRSTRRANSPVLLSLRSTAQS